MIICTRCGQENDDEQRFCARCDRKLQSSFTIPDAEGEAEGGVAITRLKLTMLGLSREVLLRCLEAWAYALALLAVALWCGRNGIYWPLYILLPVLALVLRLRKV